MNGASPGRVSAFGLAATFLLLGACSDGGSPATNGDGGIGTKNDGGLAADDGGSQATNRGPAYPPPASRGASVPYWEYEAEDAKSDGVAIGPSRAFGDIAAEASGRRAVRLEANGQGVEFETAHPASSIVVRYAIPDSPNGGGIDATLGLYVNGARTKDLAVTSRYSWVYGGESSSSNNTPGSGAHHFYDEVHLRIDELPIGSKVRIQKDPQDTAAYYVIDLVDFEEVSAPLAMPDNAVSIADQGATPDDETDDSAAIQKTIDIAKSSGKIAWIPAGTFESIGAPLFVSGVTVRGAGMWHSTIHGHNAQFKVSGSDNQFYDFAIMGDIDTRDDKSSDNGFDGPAGTGSRLENVWIEHEKCGYWVGKGSLVGPPSQPLTDGLVIHGIRVRNTYADGVNLCNGTSHSVVEQSTFRNTGDDAVAIWSPSNDGPSNVNDVIRFNTVQTPWRANCYAIYGGQDNRIEDNVCDDTVLYPGILISSGFSAQPFAGTTSVQRNTLNRAGGSMYGQQHGALKIVGEQAAITNVTVKDVVIADSTFAGIHVQGPKAISGLTFDNVQVTDSGTAGLLVSANAQGSATANNVSVSGGASGLQNDAQNAWTFDRGAGDTGW